MHIYDVEGGICHSMHVNVMGTKLMSQVCGVSYFLFLLYVFRNGTQSQAYIASVLTFNWPLC